MPEIRYVAATKTYEVKLPGDTFRALIDDARPPENGKEINFSISGYPNSSNVMAHASFDGLQYSNLVFWSAPSGEGLLAFGIPTPPGAVPTTGTASFTGRLLGTSPELSTCCPWDYGEFPSFIKGSIILSFDFGAGTLGGSISPILLADKEYALGSFAFKDTVYAKGSTTFSGAFAIPLPGPNSFSGQFTGPSAQELIGGFRLPYTSPVDSKTYDATGAFVGKKGGGGS